MIPRFPGDPPRDLTRPLEELLLRIDARHDGERIDRALQAFLTWRSRTSIHRLIGEGLVQVRGLVARPSTRVRRGDVVRVELPKPPEPVAQVAPDGAGITILHEDRWMVALDKPPGLAVHPAGRRLYGTLIHWLHQRYRRPDDPAHDVVPRLLHRIDRETSGVVAVGLHEEFHSHVARQFEDRQVAKVYLAVVHGGPQQDAGIVDFGIGPARGSAIRLKLEARRDGSGLPALTRYRVLRRSAAYSLVELHPKTGRTHQLRVHMDAIGCPLVGDKIYGCDESVFLEQLRGELSDASRAQLVLERHALHAWRLTLRHPFAADPDLVLEAPLPADMAALVPA